LRLGRGGDDDDETYLYKYFLFFEWHFVVPRLRGDRRFRALSVKTNQRPFRAVLFGESKDWLQENKTP